MVQLSAEGKAAVIAKALSRGDISLKQIASERGIGYSTLQKWLSEARKAGKGDGCASHETIKDGSQKLPLEHLLSTTELDDEAIGAYCRAQGIHSFQLKQWRDELMTHTAAGKKENKYSKEIKALRDENKRLKKDLHRKDKALAETSALLVLKKKADLIWGELADD